MLSRLVVTLEAAGTIGDPSLGDKVIDMFKLALYEDECTLAI